MKRIYITGVLIFIFLVQSFTQDTISLDLCYTKAIYNYPLTQQRELLTASNDLKIKNLNNNYLPQLIFNGQIHYQSDVTKVPIQRIPGIDIPILDKDWYKFNIDASQLIYDGGISGKQKALEDVSLQIDRQNLELQLFNLKERINQVYFNILLLRESLKTLMLLKENLGEKLSEVESGVKNGVLLASNADILKVELIKTEQSIAEVNIGIEAAIGILNELTGLNINKNTIIQLPEAKVNLEVFENNRIEYSLLSLQQNKINTIKKVTSTKRFPRISAFGQAGYGRPGYDMLKNDFEDYYMIGARLNWNIWDWNHTKREKEILDIQNKIINTQKETFDITLEIELENKIAGIRKYEEMIKRDQEIIELRSKIVKSASSQLNNGIITSTEYLTELNAETQAKFNLQAHKIRLVNAKLDYLATLGNL